MMRFINAMKCRRTRHLSKQRRSFLFFKLGNTLGYSFTITGSPRISQKDILGLPRRSDRAMYPTTYNMQRTYRMLMRDGERILGKRSRNLLNLLNLIGLSSPISPTVHHVRGKTKFHCQPPDRAFFSFSVGVTETTSAEGHEVRGNYCN